MKSEHWLRIGKLVLFAGLWLTQSAVGAELRIGIIGCDTSHCVAFTETFNNPQGKSYVPGGKVVAAYKGGSADLPQSISRVENIATNLQSKYGVKIYDTIEELCSNVDVILLESVDGRPHLAQVRPVIAARKAVCVDKPCTASLEDALEMFRLAKAANVPIFSSSSLRFAKDTQAVHSGLIGKVFYAETTSPLELEPHHPELFWYGVHGVESLFTVMGTGCETVQRRIGTNGLVEVVGTWHGGRTGIYREEKQKNYNANYHGIAKGEKGEAKIGSFDGYAPLDEAIMKFFQNGVAPVPPEETIEIMAFMQAAQESKDRDGAIIRLEDVITKVHQQVRADSGKTLAHEN
jgi:predicted dehydrogenase